MFGRALLCLFALGVSNGDYSVLRKNVLEAEKVRHVGGNITLTLEEAQVDMLLMKLKLEDLMSYDDDKFLPAKTFTSVKAEIERSKLFEYIRRVPKGCSLHTHLLASVDVDYVVRNLTYRPDLYSCTKNGQLRLRFLQENHNNLDCDWKLVKTSRENDPKFDDKLRSALTLTPNDKTRIQKWTKLSSIFTTMHGLVTYKPVFEDYVYRALTELQDDNVQCAEFKGTLMRLYELNGTVWDESESMRVFRNVVGHFAHHNSQFVGAKYVYSPSRKAGEEDIKVHKEALVKIRRRYSDFVVGFDLVGWEDKGTSLHKLTKELQSLDKNVRYFFHAGETNWFGSQADINILDAVLLGASRLGHALSLVKHPEIFNMVKSRNVAVEVCPISNQMLGLVGDLRNHPGAVYIAHGLPVIICNDDPAVWGASGLSYDWYVTFLAMTDEAAGLGFFKEVGLNSIRYSGLGRMEKEAAYRVYERQWQGYVNETGLMLDVLKKMFG